MTAAAAAATPYGVATVGSGRRTASRRIAADLVGFLDALAVIAGGIVPAVIYQIGGELPVNWLKHLQICLLSAGIVYACLRNFGHYDTSRLHDFPTAPAQLGASLVIAFLAILGLGLPFAPRDMHMWVWYGVWLSMSFVLLVNMRFAVHAVLARMTKAGAFDERVAVYGSGVIAQRVYDHLKTPDLGVHFAGLFDDRQDAKRSDAPGLAPAGRLADLVARARDGEIDRIIIALPQAADQRTQQIARRLEPLPVSLHVVTHIASDLVDQGPAHQVSAVGPVGLIDVKPRPLADWGRLVKAIEDKVLSALLVAVTLPLVALIALAIRLDSKGPVFFRQRRKGLNGAVIEVIKFRTMHVLEDGGTIVQAPRNDPRVTRVGRFLRRTSLDELPQIYNVLRGDMSLVGPRPHALAHDAQFAEIAARYPNRHQVKPGITGLAQIEGFRGEIESPQMLTRRLERDLAYVANWSLWLDLKILALTPFGCIFTRRAY